MVFSILILWHFLSNQTEHKRKMVRASSLRADEHEEREAICELRSRRPFASSIKGRVRVRVRLVLEKVRNMVTEKPPVPDKWEEREKIRIVEIVL